MWPDEIQTAEPFELVEFCMDNDNFLNDWEARFISDLYADGCDTLSSKQLNKLRHIASRIAKTLAE